MKAYCVLCAAWVLDNKTSWRPSNCSEDQPLFLNQDLFVLRNSFPAHAISTEMSYFKREWMMGLYNKRTRKLRDLLYDMALQKLQLELCHNGKKLKKLSFHLRERWYFSGPYIFMTVISSWWINTFIVI